MISFLQSQLSNRERTTQLVLTGIAIILWMLIPIPDYLTILYMIVLHCILGYFSSHSVLGTTIMVVLLTGFIIIVRATIVSLANSEFTFLTVLLFLPLFSLAQLVIGCIFGSLGATLRTRRAS